MNLSRKRILQNTLNVKRGFDPLTSVTSGTLKFWVESDSHIYQDAAKTTLATASDDVVGAIVDESNNGHDFLQSISGNKPKFQANTVGNMPSILFDGVDDFLSTTAFDTGIGFGGYTLFVSCSVFDHSNHCINSVNDLAFFPSGNPIFQHGNNWRLYSTSVDNTPHVFTLRRPIGGHTRLWVDGVLDPNDAPEIDNTILGNFAFYLGAYAEGNYPFSGHWFGTGFYSGVLSDEDRICVENYLLNKISTPTQSQSWYAQP